MPDAVRSAHPAKNGPGTADQGTDPPLPSASHLPARDENGSDTKEDSSNSSALANSKLSSKKKEALSQVPCKFFRSNGCSAGANCPFSHTMPGGAQKATCQWFLKGNCRFGHKCALAHIFPGQPISMDRKNKRAVQHGQQLPQTATEAAAQISNQASRAQHPTLPGRPGHSSNNVSVSDSQAEATPVPSPRLGHNSKDKKGTKSLPSRPQPKDSSNQESEEGNRWRPGDELFELQEETSVSRSGAVPVPMPARPVHRPEAGSLSHSMRLGGVGSPGSAFGTSPFTNNAVFYSESHPNRGPESGMAIPSSATDRRMGGAHPSYLDSRKLDLNDMDNLGLSLDGMNLDDVHERGRHGRDDEGDNDRHEEDFLPSSLSDLLTPEELERRARSSRFGAQSLPVNAVTGRTHGFSLSSSRPDYPYLPSHQMHSGLVPGSLGTAGHDPPPLHTGAAYRPSALSGSLRGGALSLTRRKLDATPENGLLHRALGAPVSSSMGGISQSADPLPPPREPQLAFSPDLAPIAPGSVLPPRQFGFGGMLERGSGTSLDGSVPREYDVPHAQLHGQGRFLSGSTHHSHGVAGSGGLYPPPSSRLPGPGLVSPAGLAPVHGTQLPEEDDAIFELE